MVAGLMPGYQGSLEFDRPAPNKCDSMVKAAGPLGSARGRLPRLLRARLAALGWLSTPRERPAHELGAPPLPRRVRVRG